MEESSSRSSEYSGRKRSSNQDVSLSGARNFQPLNLWALEEDSEQEILQSEASSQLPYYMQEDQGVHGAALPSGAGPEHQGGNPGLVGHTRSHPAGGTYQKIQYKYPNSKLAGKGRGLLQQYFWIKATWIGDEKKSVLVDIASEESLQYLQSKIGERMEETYQRFRGLRHCKATVMYVATEHKTWEPLIGPDSGNSRELTPRHNRFSGPPPFQYPEIMPAGDAVPSTKPQPLSSQSLIKDCLKNGDHIFFEIEAIDLWLNIQIDLCFGTRRILKGKFQFKVNKSANLLSLKKKLQKFAIEIWAYKNQSRKRTQPAVPSGEKGLHASERAASRLKNTKEKPEFII